MYKSLAGATAGVGKHVPGKAKHGGPQLLKKRFCIALYLLKKVSTQIHRVAHLLLKIRVYLKVLSCGASPSVQKVENAAK